MKMSEQELYPTLAEIRRRLKILFAMHIGRLNAISIKDILLAILGDSAKRMDIYEKVFHWEIIKRVLKELRRDGDLFTVNIATKYYVLQTEEEYASFERKTDNHIKALNNLKATGKKWVEEKKWKTL